MKYIQNLLPTQLAPARFTTNGFGKKLVVGASLALGFVGNASATELMRLITSEAGMHRVTHEQLLNQFGVDLTGLPHGNMGLSLNGRPVPLKTSGTGRRFGAGGYIEFYAEAADNLYTDKQSFTLSLLSREEVLANERLNFGSVINKFNNSQSAAQSYQHTVVVEENLFYDFSTPSATDPFHYGQVFGIGDAIGGSYNFSLDDVAGSAASIEIEMIGLLDFPIQGNDHHFEAVVNGITVGDQQFDGNSLSKLTVEANVSEGANTVGFNFRGIAGVPFDFLAMNRAVVRYERYATAVDGYLEGRFNSAQARISNMNTDNATVYRRNADGGIDEIRGGRTNAGGVSFSTNGVDADYIVVADGAYMQIDSVMAINDASAINSGSAEYLIIAHPSLMGPTLDELVALRSQKYSVKVVDVNDIYTEYGNSLANADSIQDYINFAVANLDTRFVVIVGSDTYDYKGFLTDSVSLVPTRYVSTQGGSLRVNQTASDAVYGDIDEDGVPDVPVGRLSARTPTELGFIMQKITDYEARQGYSGVILMAADEDDDGANISFAEDAQDMIDAIPGNLGSSVRGDFRAFPSVDGVEQARDKLNTAVNLGVSVVSYIGHSSQQTWSRTTPPMFTAAEAQELTNDGKPAIFTQWGCWNTYFVDPAGNSMADILLSRSNTGAVAVMGASTLTSANDERALGIELNRTLYTEGLTVGEAVIRAKQNLAQTLDSDAMQLGWQILGDPALIINN